MARVTQQTKSTMIASHLSASHMDTLVREIIEDQTNMSLSLAETGTAYAAPFAGYARNVTDDLDSNVKTLEVEVWRDLDSDLTYDSNEPGFTTITSVTHY